MNYQQKRPFWQILEKPACPLLIVFGQPIIYLYLMFNVTRVIIEIAVCKGYRNGIKILTELKQLYLYQKFRPFCLSIFYKKFVNDTTICQNSRSQKILAH